MSASGSEAGRRVRAVPAGDTRARSVCETCGHIDYRNPLVVVGSVTVWEERILLCRRAIDPRSGYWTLPAGYLELNETSEAGACREAMEEASARIAIDGLLAVYNIPRLSQVQLIYRAHLLDARIAPGEESLEVALFDWEALPWDDLAFPSVQWALRHYREGAETGATQTRTNPPGASGDY